MIGLLFERQLPHAKLRRWQLDHPLPRLSDSVHDAVELSWIDRGIARYRIGGRTFEVEAGGAMVVPAGVEHRTELVPGTSAGSMWISTELVEEIGEAAKAAPAIGLLSRSGVVDRGRALLSAAEADVDPLLAESALDGLILRIIAPELRLNGTRDPRIRRAVEEIEARYMDAIDVADLAQTARMSRFHFSRVFREETGASPYQYLIKIRVERAAALLAAGGLNVTEAAMAVGFSDLGRFGRAFKAQLGRTPSAFLASTDRTKISTNRMAKRTSAIVPCGRA